VRAGQVGAEAGAGGERAKEGKRLRLSLHLHRLELFVLEDALSGAIGLLGAGDPVHRCRPLQAGGGVDDVAGDDPLPLFGAGAQGHDRLPRVDADAYLQRQRRVGVVQLVDRLQDAEAGPDGALCIVLVRHGRAEDGHHRIADELLHGAAVALDLLSQAGVVGADAGAHVLGVCRFGGRGEADEAAEEDGHDLALVNGCCRLLGQRRRAEGTEG
jgi:hypothetical protein